mmetsp:Transcript_7464/g.33142  ORF Transcript_7464/g.33142 Transcript_7464/m.33142 type:complete len:302 (-) Transcript_7464:958-1863(-)
MDFPTSPNLMPTPCTGEPSSLSTGAWTTTYSYPFSAAPAITASSAISIAVHAPPIRSTSLKMKLLFRVATAERTTTFLIFPGESDSITLPIPKPTARMGEFFPPSQSLDGIAVDPRHEIRVSASAKDVSSLSSFSFTSTTETSNLSLVPKTSRAFASSLTSALTFPLPPSDNNFFTTSLPVLPVAPTTTVTPSPALADTHTRLRDPLPNLQPPNPIPTKPIILILTPPQNGNRINSTQKVRDSTEDPNVHPNQQPHQPHKRKTKNRIARHTTQPKTSFNPYNTFLHTMKTFSSAENPETPR